jgi:hypothetical protein
MVFGDVGTLARRVEWQAPLDHLDEAASANERAVLRRLMRYVMGDGQYSHEFHVRHDGPPTSAAAPRTASVRRPVGREGSNA